MLVRMALRLCLGVALVVAVGGAQAAAPDPLDALFANDTHSTPGCAVGIDGTAHAQATHGYGMADLEHNVPITPDTIFEAGSISKQFTAAAILALVQDGRIALSDNIRKYLPEIPDYGTPITVNQLLNHTSGLRDWGDEEDLAGWPRTDRVYDLNNVLNILSRQKALNYKPGTHWSYTNSGYNLAAIIVARVSGRSLADFTYDRFFRPLGMDHTSWRDNYRRIVVGRAIAYQRQGSGYEQLMPFENAYGNGGLLTTVGDLLIWNRAIIAGTLGPFITGKLEEPSKLANGKKLNYARGLFLDQQHGLPELAHSGSTAGYSAWLSNFPNNGTSVAILCNAADALPHDLVLKVEDLYLPKEAPPPQPTKPPANLADWYADSRDGSAVHVVKAPDGSASAMGQPVVSVAGQVRIGRTLLKPVAGGRLQGSSEGDPYELVPEKAWDPGDKDLAALPGRYASDEAHAVMVVSVKNGALVIAPDDRPTFVRTLTPAYKDAFGSNEMTARVKRGARGRIDGLILSNSRVWSLLFTRQAEEKPKPPPRG